MQEKQVGKITHYYGHLSVGIIELSDTLKVGDNIHIKGHTSDFTQTVDSIQKEHASIQEAVAQETVGIKVVSKAHPHDIVYRTNS